MAIFTTKKIISASRALGEFVGTLKFGEKGQLSNEPTVVYLRQMCTGVAILIFYNKKK